MRVILLAAGRGTRLGVLTDQTPKPLLEVAGRPILVRILDGLYAAGVRDVAIVTGYRGEMIRSELGNGAAVGMHIEYREQTALDGTARALALARDFAGDESFAFGWGDVLFEPQSYRRVVRASRLADGALAVNEMDDLSQGGAVTVRSEGDTLFATGLVEKPAADPVDTRWNNAGFGVLAPEIWEYIDALEPDAKGEYMLPTAIGAWLQSGACVRAVAIEGPWFDIGTPESLEAARAAFGSTS
jgi:UDP-N-acetylglucosamine diphosphorylase / glucose-1-phosphate thymidylyltransferase / UDP-N-acetylgalactosamine diphosphorylase / glucosamine-1-phosphate N-acetyltransferase / galactosamine-1-phosphate N-acetyltransferase